MLKEVYTAKPDCLVELEFKHERVLWIEKDELQRLWLTAINTFGKMVTILITYPFFEEIKDQFLGPLYVGKNCFHPPLLTYEDFKDWDPDQYYKNMVFRGKIMPKMKFVYKGEIMSDEIKKDEMRNVCGTTNEQNLINSLLKKIELYQHQLTFFRVQNMELREKIVELKKNQKA